MNMYNFLKKNVKSLKYIFFNYINSFKLSSLLYDISYNLLASIISSLARVSIIIIITSFYSKEEFGIWATITSAVAIIATGGDLGIVNSLRNKLGELYAKGGENMKVAKQYFFTAFYIFIFLAISLSICFTILYYYLPFESLFKTNNEILKAQGENIIFIVQFVFFAGIPLSIGNASFYSFNESRFAALFTTIQSLGLLIFVLVTSILHVNILVISVGYFIVIQLINLISLLYFIYRRKWFVIHSNKLDFSSYLGKSKYLLFHGFKFLGLQFSKGFIENAGTVIASSSLSLSIAADFNLVQKLYTFFISIYQSVFNPLWGAFTVNATKNNWKWCKEKYNLTLIITSIIVPFVTIIFIILGNSFLQILGGTEYRVGKGLFFLMGLSTYFYMLFTSVTTFQSSISKINFITALMISFAIITIPATKLFSNLYGIDGIAFGLALIWAVSFLLGNFQSYSIIKNKIKAYGAK